MTFRPFSLLAFTLVLCGGCASITDGSIQDVTVLTPGAKNAQCKLSVGSVEYVYEPPMTRSIQKSGETMMVDCWAPGNRHKVVYIKPTTSPTTMYNAANGVAPGFAWDYASKSLYYYPKAIEVDFTQTEIKPFPLPAQNQEDIRQPEDYDLEEFSPSQPRLNSDRFATTPEVRRREIPTEFDLQGFTNEDVDPSGATSATGGSGESSGARRVIGTVNEGISVPAPPSAAEKAAAAGAPESKQLGEPAEGTAEGTTPSESTEPQPITVPFQ